MWSLAPRNDQPVQAVERWLRYRYRIPNDKSAPAIDFVGLPVRARHKPMSHAQRLLLQSSVEYQEHRSLQREYAISRWLRQPRTPRKIGRWFVESYQYRRALGSAWKPETLTLYVGW